MKKCAKESGHYRTSAYFNYHLMLEPYADVFGRENIHVRDYTGVPDVRTDFLSLLGLNGYENDFCFAARANKSSPPEHVQIIRAVNQGLATFGECSHGEYEWSNSIRWRIRDALHPLGAGTGGFLFREEIEEIISRFEESNGQIERDYLSPGALAHWSHIEGATAQPRRVTTVPALVSALTDVATGAEKETRTLRAERDGLQEMIEQRGRDIAQSKSIIDAQDGTIKSLRQKALLQEEEMSHLRETVLSQEQTIDTLKADLSKRKQLAAERMATAERLKSDLLQLSAELKTQREQCEILRLRFEHSIAQRAKRLLSLVRRG